MKKSARPDLVIAIILTILIVGFTGIAEVVSRTTSIFDGYLDGIYYKILGFFIYALGIIWIWWTGHLLRSVAFGATLKYNTPLTFARHPYFAALLYAFYPGTALILGKFEILLASVVLLPIMHFFVFRIGRTKSDAIVKERSKNIQNLMVAEDVITPGKYLLKYGKMTEFVEVFAYFFLIVFAIEFFLNPLPAIMSFTLQLILGIFIGLVTIIWVFWTLKALKQKKQSPVFFNSGPYKFCRHPLYTAFLFGVYPLMIVVFNSSEFLISFPFLLTAAHMISRDEEYYNFKIFGEKWEQYTASHPRFIPYFGANREDASKKRREFAMSALIMSALLFIAVILMFALALTGIFSINHDSFYISLMIILLIVSAIAMFPAWEYRKRICTIFVFLMMLIVVVLVHHTQTSKGIHDEVNEFFAEVQNPKSERWIEFVKNNVLELNDKVKINAQQFIDENEKLIHNLTVGVPRDMSDYRQVDFIFPFVKTEHQVYVTLTISKNAPVKPVKSDDYSMSPITETEKDPYKAESLKLLLTLKAANYTDWRKDLGLPKYRIQKIELQD